MIIDLISIRKNLKKINSWGISPILMTAQLSIFCSSSHQTLRSLLDRRYWCSSPHLAGGEPAAAGEGVQGVGLPAPAPRQPGHLHRGGRHPPHPRHVVRPGRGEENICCSVKIFTRCLPRVRGGQLHWRGPGDEAEHVQAGGRDLTGALNRGGC